MADFFVPAYTDNNPVSNPVGSLTTADPILAEPAITRTIGRFDPGFSLSYPGGPRATRPAPANPVDYQLVDDVAGGPAGVLRVAPGDTVAWSRGGFDFSGVTQNNNIVQFPAGSLAQLHAAAHDYFAVLFYARMPTQENWNTSGQLTPMFCCTGGATGYPTEADLLTIAQQNAPRLTFRRQIDGGNTALQLNITPDATIFGKVCQIVYVRHAGGQFASVRPLAGVAKTAASEVGANNSGDYSAAIPRFGIPVSFNNGPGGSSTMPAALQAAARWKLYDCSIFDLSGGGNPLTKDANSKDMFERDHDRVLKLIAQNAAANGGVAQIYN